MDRNERESHLGLGDRITEAPAPELVQSAFMLEARDGALLYGGMSLADLAQVIMLMESGLLTPEAGHRLLEALLEMHAIAPTEFPFQPELDDVYTHRKHMLSQKVPDVAGWLQAGRPRREAATIAYLLVVRDKLLALIQAVLDAMAALLDVAAAHRSTVMPDYTYLQLANPTTLAHYLLTFVQPMTRDLARLRLAFDHTTRSPAGAGCTNGSRLPLDRERLAELLGFEGVMPHTRDAMWQPDTPIEVMAALVALMTNIDRLAEDLQIWATTEFGFIELSDRHSRISVIMPQKKNPYSLAFVRGMAREMIGRLASTAALQTTPSGQVDNRIFTYSSVPHALTQTTQALLLLAGTVSGMTVHKDVMARRAAEGFSGAMDLADMIMMQQHLDARTAHRIVGRAVRLALEAETSLGANVLDAAAQAILGRTLKISDQQIAQVVDPQTIIDTRTGLGGASPQAVQEMILSLRHRHTEYERWCATQQATIKTVEAHLVEQAAALCQHI